MKESTAHFIADTTIATILAILSGVFGVLVGMDVPSVLAVGIFASALYSFTLG